MAIELLTGTESSWRGRILAVDRVMLLPMTLIVSVSIVCVAPFVIMLLLSLTPSGAWQEMISVLRGRFTSDAYRFVWTQLEFNRLFLNSLVVAVATSITQTVSCSMAGYVLAQMHFHGRQVLLLMLLATMMIPEAVLVLPMLEIAYGRVLGETPDSTLMIYLNGAVLICLAIIVTMTVLLSASFAGIVFRRKGIGTLVVVGVLIVIAVAIFATASNLYSPYAERWYREAWSPIWTNSTKILVIPFIANPMAIFLFRQFFLQIPKEQWDAARLDGDGHLRFFIRIAAPTNASAFAALAVLSFIGSWNNLLWPMLTQDKMLGVPTLNVGLASLQDDGGQALNVEMAAAVVTIVPVLIVYTIGMKWLVRSLGHVGMR